MVMVVRNSQCVQQRRVRFHYQLEGAVDAFSDVVQWYWIILEREHPPVVGYQLTVNTPGAMEFPFDAYVHRFDNPEVPSVELTPDRSRLTVRFDRIPDGDGVEIRYLMDPELSSVRGSEPAFERLLEDEARIAGLVVDWAFPLLTGVVASDGFRVDTVVVGRFAARLSTLGVDVIVLVVDGFAGDSLAEVEDYLDAALIHYDLQGAPGRFMVFIGTRPLPGSNDLRPLFLDYGPNLAGVLERPTSVGTEADRIREEVMIPRLLEGDFTGAVLGALRALSIAMKRSGW